AAARKLIPGSICLGKLRRDLSSLTAAMDSGIVEDRRTPILDRWGYFHPVQQKRVVDRNKILIALMGEEDSYSDLHQLLLKANMPVICHRARTFRCILKPSSERHKRIATHLEQSLVRTERQVLRLYRARNKLAHGGGTPESVYDLIRHANFYLTNLI